MSSPDTDAAEQTGGAADAPADEARAGLVEAFTQELGEQVVGSWIRPGDDVCIRVATGAWRQAGELAKDKLGCHYFGFLSAIDWKPSPWGRYEDAIGDPDDATAEPDAAAEAPPSPDAPLTAGVAGGDTRFQVFARIASVTKPVAVTLKVDVPDDTMTVDSWVRLYAGADWHERETWEMFGITFAGHPGLRHIYLPTGFEGHPLRKDFPLLARVVKPWPGIVDVERMPGEAAEAEGAEGEEGGDA